MTKSSFLEELADALCDLAQDDIQNSLDYYSEMIDERIEAGMSEEDAVAELGTPYSAAREIMLDMPLPKVIKSKCKKKSAWKAWEIVLLILGSPIWLSLGIAVLAIILAVYVVLWSVVISLWAVDAGVLLSTFSSITIFGTTVSTAPIFSLLYLGIGIFALGFSVLLFFALVKLTRIFVKISIKITKKLKSLIIGRKDKNENCN